MRTDGPDHRILLKSFKYKDVTAKEKFRWNGASSPRLLWGVIPPFKNPKSSCIHDTVCEQAKQLRLAGYKKEALELRKYGDKLYKELAGNPSNKKTRWITQNLGWAGVRLGSFFGLGW